MFLQESPGFQEGLVEGNTEHLVLHDIAHLQVYALHFFRRIDVKAFQDEAHFRFQFSLAGSSSL